MVCGVPGPPGAHVLRHVAGAATRHHIGAVTIRSPRVAGPTATDHHSMLWLARMLPARVCNYAIYYLMKINIPMTFSNEKCLF